MYRDVQVLSYTSHDLHSLCIDLENYSPLCRDHYDGPGATDVDL